MGEGKIWKIKICEEKLHNVCMCDLRWTLFLLVFRQCLSTLFRQANLSSIACRMHNVFMLILAVYCVVLAGRR